MSVQTKPLHIGFDISQTGAGKAGCGANAHAMIQAMLEVAPNNQYSLYPSFGDFYFDMRMPVRNPYKKGQYGPRHVTRDKASIFWNKADIEDLLNKPDIIHGNNFWCPTQLQNTRMIYTFHDMGFIEEPSWTTPLNRVGCFNGLFRASLAADWIVAISEASRKHYLATFPHFPEERIRVIHPCSRFADTSCLGKRPKALEVIGDNGFWLNVGTIEPRKNQRRLAAAYARYCTLTDNPMPLVFAGGAGWLMEDFHQYLQELNIEKHVIFTGYVSDEELIWLYRTCYANLYPSLFEGFGLPILEGMQFGAATIASNSTSIPEITHQAAILLLPEDIEGWAQSMLLLAEDPSHRQQLSIAAQKRAKEFDRKKKAMALLQLYEEVMVTPKR